MDRKTAPANTSPEALRRFTDGVAEQAEPEPRFAVVWAPSPHHDPPKGMERPVSDGGDWRPYEAVRDEAETLVLITPPKFDKETWTAPEAAGVVPPPPDSER